MIAKLMLCWGRLTLSPQTKILMGILIDEIFGNLTYQNERKSVESEPAGVRASRGNVQDAEQAAQGAVRRVHDRKIHLPDGQRPQLLSFKEGKKNRITSSFGD